MPSKEKALLVVSRYKEDLSWLSGYKNKVFVYNKGPLEVKGYDFENVPNMGGNQYDICHYIYDNYDRLPPTIAFVQGDPFDHCNKEKLDRLLEKNWFAGLESYEHLKENDCHRKCSFVDWGYMEINNSWYIKSHNQTMRKKGFEPKCPFHAFDDFMETFFEDYKHVDWIRFSPGAQYLVERERCLAYPRKFWRGLMDIFSEDGRINGGTEAHVVERAMWMIFNGFFRPRETPKLVSRPELSLRRRERLWNKLIGRK
ncbi:MAG: DUF3431 domain-containing protein [Elusimicrobiales bacterium]|nr:DUF3431 domain-containing protein [Elusimicrobiales bacterium]